MTTLNTYPLPPNFTWHELSPHAAPRDLQPEVRLALQLLAQRLQVVRDVVGSPLHITSGYRSVAYNQQVSGHPNSYHCKGMAADIVITGVPAHRVQHLLRNWQGGLGCYSTFTHVDTGPKRRWRG